MKIGFFISLNETGGSLNQTKGFLNKIKKINSEDKISIITDNKKRIEELKLVNIEVLYFKKSLLKKIYFFFIGFLSTNKFFSFKILNPFETFIKKNNIDLLIFSNPSFYSNYCENIDYIINIWNTEINTCSSFIEFKNGNYQDQKKIIQTSIENAFRIVVFTNQNKIDLIDQFNCIPEKIIIQNLSPFLPNKFAELKETNFLDVYSKFNFDKNKKFFFYPAQFWSHKNHLYLLSALKIIISKKNDNIGFIFCGGDKGNLSFIKNKISQLNLDDNIKVLGHISDEELISIYRYSQGIVIPTYLGRSSLPLLESIYFNKKIFYSKNILDDSLKPYVVEFDLNNASDLANKLIDYSNNPQEINFDYEKINSSQLFENNYKKIIDEYRVYLNTWKS
jgi:glycosyltransferase involved in cell wall biosynthesis